MGRVGGAAVRLDVRVHVGHIARVDGRVDQGRGYGGERRALCLALGLQ